MPEAGTGNTRIKPGRRSLRGLAGLMILAGLIGLLAHFNPGLFDADTRHRASDRPAVAETVARPKPRNPAGASALDGTPHLPVEARQTITLIQRGGPYPHSQDGAVFGNRERHLPPRPRGYYREYTVRTPGLKHRGARRIVTGGDPPEVWYYTDDHYESFRAFTP